MKVNINLFRQTDILEEDASLSLGWISFKEKGVEVTLFKDELCIIFITLTSLLEAIQKLQNESQRKVIEWVGEDSGVVCELFLETGNVHISTKGFSCIFLFEDFKREVVNSISRFKRDCLDKNKLILKESAFKDLDLIEKEFLC